jgi:hypothetical protein
LATIVGVFVLSRELTSLLPGQQFDRTRVHAVATSSILLLSGAALLLRDLSVIWQVGLQVSAIAGIVVWIKLIVSAIFDDWHPIFHEVGIVSLLSLALAVTSALLLRFFQSKGTRRNRAIVHLATSPIKERSGSLEAIGEELKSGTWLASAQTRAARRKSLWNLLLPLTILPLWLFAWWVAVEFACVAHLLFAGKSIPPFEDWMKVLGSEMSLAGFLIVFSPLVPTVAAAAVLGNRIVYLVPAARRAMDAEDNAVPGTVYSTAQEQLMRVIRYSAPIALPVLLLGAWLLN